MTDHTITMVEIITTVGIIVVDTTTIITADIEEDTTTIVDIDTITDVVTMHKQDDMDIIRIKSNTRTVPNTINIAINVIKRQIDPTTEVMEETEVIRETEVIEVTEVTVEIHQEQIMGITIDPQETEVAHTTGHQEIEAVHTDHQAAGVDLPGHQDADSNFCYNTND